MNVHWYFAEYFSEWSYCSSSKSKGRPLMLKNPVFLIQSKIIISNFQYPQLHQHVF